MSTLEYGTYTGPPLTGERLHRCLIDLQDATIRKHHLRRPSLSVSDYEDLYARAMLVLVEKHPDASFPAPQAVVSWLDVTIGRAAIDVLRRRNLGRETGEIVSVSDARGAEDEQIAVQPVDGAPTPEQQVLLSEDSLTLNEFIASLDPDDRKISLLHLHPGSRMRLKQIAHALDLPDSQVNTVLKRVDKRFSRYAALEVDAVCALRQRDLAAWKRTGEMPAALKWHAKRCSTCKQKIEAARTQVYRSLLPLAGAVALPAAGGTGVFAGLYQSLGSHPLVVRTSAELSRVRRLGGFGAGGGGAVLGAKAMVAAVSVGAVAAAGAGVAVLQAEGGTPHAPSASNAPTLSAKARETTAIGSTSLVVGSTTSTAPTSATTTTRVKRAAIRRHRRHHKTAAASATTTTPVLATPSSGPTASSAPVAVRAPSTSGTTQATRARTAATSSTSGAGSSPPGALPDVKQTEQAP